MLDMALLVISAEGRESTQDQIVYISKRIRQCLLYLQKVKRLVRPIRMEGTKHLGWVMFDSA